MSSQQLLNPLPRSCPSWPLCWRNHNGFYIWTSGKSPQNYFQHYPETQHRVCQTFNYHFQHLHLAGSQHLTLSKYLRCCVIWKESLLLEICAIGREPIQLDSSRSLDPFAFGASCCKLLSPSLLSSLCWRSLLDNTSPSILQPCLGCGAQLGVSSSWFYWCNLLLWTARIVCEMAPLCICEDVVASCLVYKSHALSKIWVSPRKEMYHCWNLVTPVFPE